MTVAVPRVTRPSPAAERMARVFQTRAAFFQRRFGLALGELAAVRLAARRALQDVVIHEPDEHAADQDGEGVIVIGRQGRAALQAIMVATGACSPAWEAGGDAVVGALGQLLAVERRDVAEEVAQRFKIALSAMSCATHNKNDILMAIDRAVEEAAPMPPPPSGLSF